MPDEEAVSAPEMSEEELKENLPPRTVEKLEQAKQEDQEKKEAPTSTTSTSNSKVAGAIIKETNIKEAEYAAGTESPFSGKETAKPKASIPERHGNDLAGVPKKDRDFILMLDDLADSGKDDYRVLLFRKNPRIWGDVKLSVGKILHVYEPQPFNDIRDWTLQEFGGGQYELKIVQVEGNLAFGNYTVMKKMTFWHDPAELNPKPDKNATTGPNDDPLAVVAKGRVASGEADVDEIEKIRRESRLLDEKRRIAEQKHQADLEEERRETERLRVEEKKRLREEGPKMEAQRAAEAEKVRQESSMTSLVTGMQQQTTELIKTLASQKNDNGNSGEGLMAAALKAISDSNATMMKAIADMNNRPVEKDNSAEMIMRIQQESNKQLLTIMQSSNETLRTQLMAQQEKNEAFVSRILERRMDDPDANMKKMMDMRAEGKKEAMEWFELLKSVEGAVEDEGWDPDAGFMGNVGQLAFAGIKKLIGGASGPAGQRLLEGINQVLSKPAGNTQFSDAEIQQAADQMQPYLLQEGYGAGQKLPERPALPTPPQQAPVQQQPAEATRVPRQVYETIAPTQEAPLYTPPPQQPVAQLPAVPPVADDPEVEFDPRESAEERLRYHVNEVLADALADIADERNSHQWQYQAFESLNRPFLDELASAPDHNSRVQIFKKYADPAVFDKLVNSFWAPGGETHWYKFSEALNTLVTMHQEKSHAPTQ